MFLEKSIKLIGFYTVWKRWRWRGKSRAFDWKGMENYLQFLFVTDRDLVSKKGNWKIGKSLYLENYLTNASYYKREQDV